MGNIKIEKMVLGMVQTNTWFVINEKTKELILIDPADDAGRIIRKIEADGLKLQSSTNLSSQRRFIVRGAPQTGQRGIKAVGIRKSRCSLTIS